MNTVCGVNDSKKSLTGRKSVIARNNRFLLYLLTFFQWRISRGHAFFYVKTKDEGGYAVRPRAVGSFLYRFFFPLFFSISFPPPFSVILIGLKLRISSGNENYTLSSAFLFIRSKQSTITSSSTKPIRRMNKRDILIVRFIMSVCTLAMTMTDAKPRRIAMHITNKYRTLCPVSSNVPAHRLLLGWVSKRHRDESEGHYV